MIYIKHLPEHIIALLTPQQWLSIILRIKVSLPVGETYLQNYSSTCLSILIISLLHLRLDTPAYLFINSISLGYDAVDFMPLCFASPLPSF